VYASGTWCDVCYTWHWGTGRGVLRLRVWGGARFKVSDSRACGVVWSVWEWGVGRGIMCLTVWRGARFVLPARFALARQARKNYAKNDFQYGRWNSSTMRCGRWLWDDMTKRPLYWNSTSGFWLDRIIAVGLSFCTSLRNNPNRTALGRKKWRHVDFQDGRSPTTWILRVQ